MIIIGVTGGVLTFVGGMGIKERTFTQNQEPMKFWAGLKEIVTNKAFWIYAIFNFTFWIGQSILTSSVLYYIQYVQEADFLFSMILPLSFFIAVFTFIPFWKWVMVKLELKRTVIICLFCCVTGLVIFYFTGNYQYLALIGLFAIGAAFAGAYLLTPLVFAEVVDVSETRTGKRRETTYAGINSLIQKPTVSIGPAIFLAIINAAGFDNLSSTQTQPVKNAIVLAITLIPAAIMLLAGLMMFFYPLAGPKWREQKLELAEQHKLKEEEAFRNLEGFEEDSSKG
jgi:Na+/melibiose symporter-like transporter